MTMNENDNLQSSEEMVDGVGKQSMSTDVVRRHLKINKVGPNRTHSKSHYMNKEVLIELRKFLYFSAKSTLPNASLGSLYSNACSKGNKPDEFEICVLSQS